MNKENKIQLFQKQAVRTFWDEEDERWYFSVQDVVQILSESVDVKQYIKKMRSRDPELNNNWGTICTPLPMLAADGKIRKVQAAFKKHRSEKRTHRLIVVLYMFLELV